MILRWWFLVVIAALAAGCQSGTKGEKPNSDESFWLTNARIDSIREAIAEGSPPARAAWKQLQQAARKGLNHSPHPPDVWHVPLFYEDSAGANALRLPLQRSANAAYACAIMYRLTDSLAYAQKTFGILDKWSSAISQFSKSQNSTLTWSVHFPKMILAADLISASGLSWPAGLKDQFQTFVSEKAIPQSSFAFHNNWGNWGMWLVTTGAAYLETDSLLDLAQKRHLDFLEYQHDSEGTLVFENTRENGRNGISYSHYSLLPTTLSLQVFRQTGSDLFDTTSVSGHGLEKAFRKLAGWCQDPASFPYWHGSPDSLNRVDNFAYFEILNARWPDTAATALLRENRPVPCREMPFLSLTHGPLYL